MRKRAYIKNKSGFTLLEVAISLAIISVVFVSITTLFNASIGITDYSGKLTKATFLAQKIMTDIESNDDISFISGDEIKLEDEYDGYSYVIEIGDTALPLIREISVTVFFESVFKKHDVRLSAYILDTLEEEGGEEKE